MGEFGAVSVISGNIIGRTQTLTLFVEAAYKVLERNCLVIMADGFQSNLCIIRFVFGLTERWVTSAWSQKFLAWLVKSLYFLSKTVGWRFLKVVTLMWLVQEYNTQGAFSAALLLSVFAVITLFIKVCMSLWKYSWNSCFLARCFQTGLEHKKDSEVWSSSHNRCACSCLIITFF